MPLDRDLVSRRVAIVVVGRPAGERRVFGVVDFRRVDADGVVRGRLVAVAADDDALVGEVRDLVVVVDEIERAEIGLVLSDLDAPQNVGVVDERRAERRRDARLGCGRPAHAGRRGHRDRGARAEFERIPPRIQLIAVVAVDYASIGRNRFVAVHLVRFRVFSFHIGRNTRPVAATRLASAEMHHTYLSFANKSISTRICIRTGPRLLAG